MPVYNSQIDRTEAQALIPEDVAGEIIGAVAYQSYLLRLARRLPDMPTRTRRLPIISVLPQAYFVNGDSGLKQTTEVDWTNKFLNAEEIAVIVPVPQAVLDDVAYDIWGEIRPLIETAFGKLIDQMILYGGLSGYTKPSNDWPDGIVKGATDASQVVDLSTNLAADPVVDLYDSLLGVGGLFSMVEEDGFAVTGNVAALSMRAQLRGARDKNGVPIFNRNPGTPAIYDLDGTQLVFPENGSVDPTKGLLVSGDFNQLVYAMRQDITYTISTDGVITDGGGQIVYNLFQQDMVAMRVVMRMAWQLPNPPTWIKSTYADATRYPFGVLVP